MDAALGNRVSPQMTVNDFKFAGLTRDATTSLDQAMLRTSSLTLNRPEQAGIFGCAYALNNPATLAGPGCVPATVSETD
jgi:hypothetical protein